MNQPPRSFDFSPYAPFWLACAAVISLIAPKPSAEAATLYWDLNGTTANTAVSATGAWNGTNAFWNTALSGTGGTAQAGTTSGDDLVLSSGTTYTTGTITASGSPAASSITFEDNVTLTLAGAVTIGGTGTKSGIFVLSGDNAANSVTGALTLGAASTIQNAGTGVLSITGGITGAFNLELQNSAATANGVTISTGSLNNTGTITNSGTGAGNTLISSVIGTNVTGVTQNSATSTLTLSGANTYTGVTTISSGTLSASNVVVATGASGLGNATSAVVLGGTSTKGTLLYTGGAATYTRNFTINAGGGEVDSTANTLTLLPGTTPTYAPIALTSGSLTLGTGATAATTYITIGSATMTGPMFTGTNVLNINGNSGGVGIVKLTNLAGTSNVVTAAAMPINIKAGTLQYVYNGTAALTSNLLGTGLITLTPAASNGGTLNLSVGGVTDTLGNAFAIADAAGTSTIVISGGITIGQAITGPSGSNTPTLLLQNSNGSPFTFTVSGGVTGKLNLQLQGTHNSANNPITLSTTAVNNAGTISNITATGSSAMTVSASVGSNVTGLTQAGISPFNISGAITANAAGLPIISTNTGLFTLSGGITGTTGTPNLAIQANSTGNITFGNAAVNNTGTITNSGTGIGTTAISSSIGSLVTNIIQNSATSPLILSGTNTYTGISNATNGLLQFTNVVSLPNFGTGTQGAVNVGSGGILGFGYAGTNQFTQANITSILDGTIAVPVNWSATGSSIGLDSSAASANYTTGIANASGTTSFGLVKLGTNTLTLGTANTFTGPASVRNGTLSVAILNSVTTPTPVASSSLGVPSSVATGTISLGFGITTGILSYSGAGETTDRVINLAGTTGGGTLDQSGSGALHLSSPMSFTGTGSKTLTLTGSTSSDGYFDGAIAGGVNAAPGGALTIAKTGTGTWHLTGTGNTAQNITINGGTLDTGANGLTLSDVGAATIQGSGSSGNTAYITGKIIFAGVATAAWNGADVGSTVAGFTLDMTGATLTGSATNTNIDFYSNGTTILGNANTFRGQVQIAGTTLVVTSLGTANGAASSSLGQPLAGNSVSGAGVQGLYSTIGLTSGTLKYVGTGETTDRAFDLHGTTTASTIDQSGIGLLKFSATTNTASGGGVKLLTLQGSTTGTGEIAGAIVDNTTTNTTGITKAGTGTWTLSGVNTFTGPTTVNAGNLILSQGGAGTGVLANTAITINSGGTLSPLAGASGYFAGNTATAAKGASLTLNAGGTLNLADGTIGNFNLLQNSSFAGNAVTFAGGAIVFDISASAADMIDVRLNNATGTGLATSSGGNAISFNPIASTLGLGSYTLIKSAGTLNNSNFFLASPNLVVGGTLYNLSLGLSGTNEVLTVATGGAAATPSTAFWKGTTDASWALGSAGGLATNWVTAATGSSDTWALPGSTTNLTLSANTVGAGGLSTTLDQNFTINSLTFSGTGTANTVGSTIATGTGTNALTINAADLSGNVLGNGITVQSGSGANTISANVVLGVSQTWTNNSTNALTLSGLISDGGSNFNLTTAGTGTTVLSNSNTYGGATTLGGGVLSVAVMANGGSASGIGSSPAAAGNLVFSGNSTLRYTGGPQVTDRAFTINTGVNATFDVTQPGTTLEMLGATGAVSTGALTKTGNGALTLSGASTYTGNTVVAGGTLNLPTGSSLTGNGVANAGSILNVGTVPGQNAVLNINGGNVNTYYSFGLGTAANSVGVLNLSGGAYNGTGTQTNNTINFVGQVGYGYLNITGGTFAAKGRFAPSNGVGTTGVIYIGGTGTFDHTAGEWFLMAYSASGNGGLSQVTVGPGGNLNRVGATQTFGLNMDRANGYAVLSIAGGQMNNGIRAISFGNGNSTVNTTGILNLAGGTLTLGAPMSNNTGTGTGNTGYLNFAGGTLRTSAGITAIIPASAAGQSITSRIYGAIDNSSVSGAPSFVGGLTVDTNGFSSTLANALLAPAGTGVRQADITLTGGAGYVGAPAVQFSKPASGGSPASGYALISAGQVTGLVITSPGEYASSETPSVTLTGGGASSAANVTIAALNTANTSGGLTKTGNGTLTLSGTNTYTGVTTASVGTLQFANQLSLYNNTPASWTASNIVVNSGATLALNVGGVGQFVSTDVDIIKTLGTATGGFLSGSTLGLDTAGGAFSYASLIGDTNSGANAVGLAKLGTNTLTLTNNANSYTGPTTLFGGILSVAKIEVGGNISGIGAATNAAANLVLRGGTLQYTGTGDTTDRNFTFGNATTAAGGGFDTTGATGPLVISGSMTGANAAAGTQVLTLTSLAASGANALNGNIVDSSGTALTGVTKAGAGAWTLGGSNTYSGLTTVSSGTLNVIGTNTGGGAYTMSGTGILTVNSSGTVAASVLTPASGTTINLDGGIFSLSGNVPNSTGAQLKFNGGTLKSAAPITIGSGLPIAILAGGGTVDTTGGNITSNSGFSNTASPGTFNIIGGNTLQAAVNATQTGPVNITGTGTTLKLVTTAAVYPNLWTVGTGANLDMNNVGNFSFGGLAGGGNILNTGASALRTITITGAGGNSFSGSIQQPSPSSTSATGLTLNLSSPSATQTLSGANTYGGPTTITQGTLVFSGGSLANTAISVTNGNTLAVRPGAGSLTAGNNLTAALGASLNIASGGIFSMLDGSIGTFNLTQNATFATAGLTLNASTLNLELSSAGADQIVVSGGSFSSVISGINTIDITTLGTSLTPGPYTILTAPGITAANTYFRFGNGTPNQSVTVGLLSYPLTLSGVTGFEQLIVGAGVGNLTWTGQTNGTGSTNSIWTPTPGSNNNFADLSPAVADYSEGSAVTFQDLNSISTANVSNSTVTIDSAGVNPGAVTVNNTAVDYIIQNASGTIGIAGTTGLTKSGNGKLTLNSANTYTGATVLNGGVLNVGIDTALGIGAISFGGGTLQFGAGVTTDFSSRFSTVAGELTRIDTNGNNVTFATALTSVGGTLTKSGAGTLTLTAANTFNGAVTVDGGTLLANLANNFANPTNSALGNPQAVRSITVNNGGNLKFGLNDTLGNAASTTIASTLVINAGGIVSNNGNNFTTLGPVVLNGGNLTTTGGNSNSYQSYNLLGTVTVGGSTASTISGSGTFSGINLAAAGTTFNVADVTASNATDLTISAPLVNTAATTPAAAALIKTGLGTLTSTGGANYTGATTVSGGTLQIQGAGTIGGVASTTAITVNAVAANRPILLVSGSATLNGKFVVGTGSNVGAVYQSGGTVNVSGNSGADTFIGSAANGYGFYQLSSGNLNSTSYMSFGNNGTAGNTAAGVFYQSGGAIALSGTGWFQTGYQGNSAGVNYFTGGTTSITAGGGIQILGYQSAATARGEVTINGGAITSAVPVTFGNAAANTGVGILNLMSGTLQATNITRTATSATGILNFNGGTYKPSANNTLTGLSSAYVFGGNAIIDTGVSSMTIGQALLAPTGNGVATIPVSTQGSGYIGAPYVRIVGGNSDATAVANMEDDGTGNGTFKVSSITITNPGNNYATLPTVSLVGGGAAIAATLGTVTTATNNSGGLTKLGANTLTLSGANSYSGKTTVSGGVLSFNTIGNVGGGNSALGAPTTIANGTIDLDGTLTYTGAVTSTNRVINLTNAATGSTIQNTGSGLLTLNGDITGNATNLLFRGTASTTMNGVIGATLTGTVSHTDASTLTLTNASNAWTGNLSVSAGIVSVNTVANKNLPSAIGAGTLITLGQSGFNNTGTFQFTGASGGSSDRDINIQSNSGNTNGGIIENTVAGQLLTLSGPVTVGGTGTTPSLGLIGAGNGTLSAGIAGSPALAITKTGTGTWTLGGTNTYSGLTTIDNGTLDFSGSASQTLGALTFGSTTAVTTVGVSNIADNMNFTALTVQNNSASSNAINLASGKAFSFSGVATIGGAAASTNKLVITGVATSGNIVTIGGGLNVGIVANGNNNASLTVVDSGLTVTGGVNIGTSSAAVGSTGTVTVNGGSATFNLGSSAMNIGLKSGTTATGTVGTSGTLDLSAATSVNISGTAGSSIVLGSNTAGAGNVAGDRAQGVLKLSISGANSVSVTTITLGNSVNPGTVGTQGQIILGNSTNTFQTDTIYVGRKKSQTGATPAFASDLISFQGSGGTLSLEGLAGAKTTLNIGYNDPSTTGTTTIGVMDLSNGTFNATLGVVTIGYVNGTNASGGGVGTLTMADGTVTADQIRLAEVAGGVAGTTAGTLNLNGGTLTLLAAGLGINGGTTVTGAATVNLDGGTLDMSGTNIGAAAPNLVSFNAKSGTLRNLNQLNNGAALTKTTVGILTLTGNNTYSGATNITGGTLALSGGGVLADSNAVNLTVIDTVFDVSAITGTEVIGSLTGVASSTVRLGSKTLELGSNSDFTFDGAVEDGGLSGGTGGSIKKTGAGVMTLSGSNTYTGGTNISGGTLLLGANDVLPNATPLNLSGGTTFRTGGWSDTTGPLSIATSASIDLGSGSSSNLTFTNTGAWSGLLNIWNYTGGGIWSASSGDTLNFNANALTSTDLANIQFYTGNEGDFGSAIGVGAGFIGSELVPVPEPTALVAGMLLLGAIGFQGRRRPQARARRS